METSIRVNIFNIKYVRILDCVYLQSFTIKVKIIICRLYALYALTSRIQCDVYLIGFKYKYLTRYITVLWVVTAACADKIIHVWCNVAYQFSKILIKHNLYKNISQNIFSENRRTQHHSLQTCKHKN